MATYVRYADRMYNRNYENLLKGKKRKSPSSGTIERDGISGVMMGENTQKSYRFPRLFLSLEFTPITSKDTSLESRQDLIVFQRMPTIVCRNSYKDDYSYVLRGGPRDMRQLSRIRIFDSYDDFIAQAGKNKYLNFIVSCFDVSPLIFELAKRNLDVEFDLPFNYDKYIKLCGGETLFAEYNELADNIVREADKRRKARKKK